MTEAEDVSALLDEVARMFAPLVLALRHDGDVFVVNLVSDDGTVVWPDYSYGPTEVLAMLAAEQRFLVEDRGSGSMPGATWDEKARERLRRWLAGTRS